VAQSASANLTFRSDKLVALAGLAARIHSGTGYQYLAGLWRETLQFDLLWTTMFDAFDPPSEKSETYRAPTWSWASADSKITTWMYGGYDLEEKSFLFQFDSSDIHPLDELDTNKLGALTSASLTLKGKTRPLYANSLSYHTEIPDAWFKIAANIHISGVYFGQLHPDTKTTDFSNIYLCPIVQTPRNSSFTTLTRPWWDMFTYTKVNYNKKISASKFIFCGLALKKLSDGGNHFERMGTFIFTYNSRDDPQASWFDDLEEQKIVLL
jgi:hypothetical protein